MWAVQAFAAITSNGERRELARGTFLITELPVDDAGDWLAIAGERFNTLFLELDSTQGFVGLPLQPLRIAMYGGGGAPFNHARIFAELGFEVDFITPQEIRHGRLSDFDILGMPGGGGLAMKGQLDPLGEDGCRIISNFVRQGGMYVGSCAGSFDAAIVSDSFLAVCPQQRYLQLVNALIWNRNDTEWIGLDSPGVGVIESRNVKPDHPVMFGLPERFPITHYNGPFFEPQPGILTEASEAVGLAAVAGSTEHFTPAEYFLRLSEYDKAAAEESCLIARAAQEGRFNIITGYNGMGRVILFGSHPEFGYNLAMDRWEAPARMLANAAFWQSSHLTGPRSTSRKIMPGTPLSFPPGSGLKAIPQKLGLIARLVNELRERSNGGSANWLRDELAMSTFGLSGEEIWRQNLATFDDVTQELTQTVSRAEKAAYDASALAQLLRNEPGAEPFHIADQLDNTLLGLEEAIHFQTPAAWQQDFGYEGVLQMLDRTEAMLRKADANFDTSFEPSANPYQYFDSSPFQLVVGSYLAALGVLANAWFLLRVHELELAERIVKAQLVLKKMGKKPERA
jgi:hypothetical protein